MTRILRFKGKISINFPTIAVHSEAESFGYYDNCSNGKGLVIFHSSPFDTSKQANKAPYVILFLKMNFLIRYFGNIKPRHLIGSKVLDFSG